MKKTLFKTIIKAGMSRDLRTNDSGIAIMVVGLIVLLFITFVIFVSNIGQIALGLAIIGISFIIIAAGINAMRNSFSKRRSSYSEYYTRG